MLLRSNKLFTFIFDVIMLEIQGKIHDRYTLEFKVGYSRHSPTAVVSDYMMDTWIFIPDSLYINQKTYPKSNFYRDFRALVRLITPVYTLVELADEKSLPLSRLIQCACQYNDNPSGEYQQAYIHQIKMFGSISRSTLRVTAANLCQKTDPVEFRAQLEHTVCLLHKIMSTYRSIPCKITTDHDSVSDALHAHSIGEEYLCRTINMHLFRIMEFAKINFPGQSQVFAAAARYIDEDMTRQRSCSYLLPKDDDKEHNRKFLYNAGMLKKFIESDLYILAVKKNNTFILQQILFMFAAGLSMVFATIISFSFQQTYGNFTMPLFIALVVSYMFKDRFKDLMHSWFANKLGSKFYDYKIKLALRDTPIGWGKEGCDFVNNDKLPLPVKIRRGNISNKVSAQNALQETVIVYRRRITIFNKRLKKLSHYPLYGLNDIIRINIRDFLRRMDSPHVPIYLNEGNGNFHTLTAEKSYYLHFIMRYRYQGTTGYKRFRLCLTRQGIKDLQEF